jgi:NADH:ubiquinone oxidoreductase subunit 6 (subunit J)
MVLPDDPKLAVYLRLVVGVLILMMALATVVMSLSGPRENIFRQRAKRLPLVAQIAIIVAAIFVAWIFATARPQLRAALDRLRFGNSQGNKLHHTLGVHVSHTYGIAVTVFLAIVAVGLLVGMWLLARRGRVLEWDSEKLDEELGEAVDEGLERLEGGGEPREAIIACYVRMQEALSAAGVTKRPSDTAFEFLARVLAQRSGVGPGAQRLTVLFERARFSDHEITEDMREEAAAALRDIRDGLQIHVPGGATV